ncbi:VOC family protein [Sanyastnella coralliicola]|uniref:VOC family protein n=1 Tax=Sanyastnella coralliicola TaxID=3069118 RepID=UPI0027B9F026|nr:VOC family protein [Longitalea sp. SCSIO 12813]
MNLGAFSVSLAVKDLQASKAFYEKLGFSAMGGVEEQNWLIMKNGSTVIGLFQGMFEQNILTFNPGWDQNAQNVDEFTDIRDLQTKLEGEGVSFTTKIDAGPEGPASFILLDPDGNPVLVDQHR